MFPNELLDCQSRIALADFFADVVRKLGYKIHGNIAVFRLCSIKLFTFPYLRINKPGIIKNSNYKYKIQTYTLYLLKFKKSSKKIEGVLVMHTDNRYKAQFVPIFNTFSCKISLRKLVISKGSNSFVKQSDKIDIVYKIKPSETIFSVSKHCFKY